MQQAPLQQPMPGSMPPAPDGMLGPQPGGFRPPMPGGMPGGMQPAPGAMPGAQQAFRPPGPGMGSGEALRLSIGLHITAVDAAQGCAGRMVTSSQSKLLRPALVLVCPTGQTSSFPAACSML